MQMGRMIATDAGKISSSLKSVKIVSKGTNIIPPPAPKSPVITPAKEPAAKMPNRFLNIKNNLLWKSSPQEVFLFG